MTNEEKSKAEVAAFIAQPLQAGESYVAYLSNDKRIVTWMGDTLAEVTRITSYRVRDSHTTDSRGSFWCIGVDGRTYYGRHNGTGMHCRMRLAKYRDDFDIEQRTHVGWEVVNCEATQRAARLSVRLYRENQPGEYRIRRRKVPQ